MSVSVSASIARKNKVSYIHVAIMFALMLGVGYLPPIAQITPLGMKVLGVFLGLVYGWCFIDLLWTSVFGFFALGLTGYTDVLSAFVAGFTNPTTVIILVCFAFAHCLKVIGVSEAIAYWLMSRKIFLGRPWLLCVGLVAGAWFMNLVGGSLAAIFLLWSVVAAIAEVNHIEKDNILLSMLYALILFAGMTGGSIVPFYAVVILYGGFFTAATGLTIPAVSFLLSGFIYSVLTFAIMMVFSKFILKVDASTFSLTEEMRLEYQNKKTTIVQKVGLVLLALYFLVLLLPSVFHGALWTTFAIWGVTGFSIIYMVVFCVWKDDKGKAICDMGDCFKHGVIWNTLLLFMVTIPVASAMESADTGIMASISALCNSLFSGLSVTVLLIIIAVVVGFLTQFMHNVVMGALFIPIFAPIVMNMGGNPMTFFFIIYLTLCCAYATPAGSMMAALIFGKEGVPVKHSYVYGWMFYIIGCIVLVVMIPLLNILFA